MLDIGTKAPAFTLSDQDEQNRSLTEFAGKWVVLYFYPKDDTPGCTKEACTIAEIYNDFAALGVVVLGVSADSPASHKKFKEKYNLPFTLLSDLSAKMMQSYKAWKQKAMFGRKFLGIQRMTYIINPSGEIVKVYPKADPASHALELLKDLKTLIK
jgi:thioredoxin-dependent peroxiredoxin